MKIRLVCVLLSSALILSCCGVTDTGAIPVETVAAEGVVAGTEAIEETIDEKAPASDDASSENSDEALSEPSVTAADEKTTDVSGEEEVPEVEEEEEEQEEPEEKPEEKPEVKPSANTNPSGGNQNSNDENRGCVGDEALVW